MQSQESNNYLLKTVVIDAGHGGRDPGTSGIYAKEKDIALSIALKVGKYIEENVPDVSVIYTRTTDVLIPLNERANIANRNKADLFISIHVDGHESKKPFGTSTYVMGLHKTDENLELAKKENSAILFEEDYTTTYEGFDPASSESYIMFSFLANTYLDQSLNYAAFVESEFKNKARRTSRGVKQAGFLVLWKTTMPSVLIETGYLTNPNEEKYLRSTQGQEYIASAIYRAFKSYKKAIEEKSNFVTRKESRKEKIPIKADPVKNVSTEKEITKNDIPITEETVKVNEPKNDNAENKAFSTENKKSDIVFKIQIASSSSSVSTSPDQFKGLDDVEEIKIDNAYKYTVGSSSNYAEIIRYKKNIEDKFPDAFIIAIENSNKLIPVNEALKILNN